MRLSTFSKFSTINPLGEFLKFQGRAGVDTCHVKTCHSIYFQVRAIGHISEQSLKQNRLHSSDDSTSIILSYNLSMYSLRGRIDSFKAMTPSSFNFFRITSQ
ncbi:uncharacterized protein LOC143445217 [Clavelina lepadiformis]